MRKWLSTTTFTIKWSDMIRCCMRVMSSWTCFTSCSIYTSLIICTWTTSCLTSIWLDISIYTWDTLCLSSVRLNFSSITWITSWLPFPRLNISSRTRVTIITGMPIKSISSSKLSNWARCSFTFSTIWTSKTFNTLCTNPAWTYNSISFIITTNTNWVSTFWA